MPYSATESFSPPSLCGLRRATVAFFPDGCAPLQEISNLLFAEMHLNSAELSVT